MQVYIPKTYDEYLEILFKRRKYFLLPFLTVMGLMLVSYPFLPRLYKSTCLIQVQAEELIDPIMQGIAVAPGLDKKFNTISSQILSWPNLEALAKRLGLDKSAKDAKHFERRIKGIKDRIEVTMPSSNLVHISYEDGNPETAKEVVDVLAENFINHDRTKYQQESLQAIKFVEDQLKIYKEKLSTSETSFIMNKVKSDLEEAMKQRRLLGDQVLQLEKTVTREVVREQNPAALRLREELNQTRMLLTQALIDAREGSPLVAEYKSRIADLERRLSHETDELIASETSVTNPAYADSVMRLKELDLQIGSLSKKLSDMQSGQFRLRDVSEQDLRSMERDKQVNEDIYRSLLVRLENAQISKRLGDQGRSEDLSVLEPARLPTVPIWPNPMKIFVFGFGAAMAAGAGAVFVREYLDGSIRGALDAKALFQIPMLAAVPRMVINESPDVFRVEPPPRKPIKFLGWTLREGGPGHNIFPYVAAPNVGSAISPFIVSFHDPKSIPSESYRLLRTHLLYMKWKNPLKTLMVTSSLEGEGKTTSAVNLAVSLAKEVSDNVLIMDCDLRKGTVGKALGVDPKKGLAEVLAKTCDLESALVKCPELNYLTVLPSGTAVHNSTELLGSRDMKAVLNSLTPRFDFIIMDTPPTLGLSDVPVLVPFTDGILLTVQAGRTDRNVVQETLKALQETHQGNVLGYVLTNIDTALPKSLHKLIPGIYQQGYYTAAEYGESVKS